ncbi:tetratricopeptide repeat protein [Candidatus Leptofilum sp.]|uniref:tetratricopeptide repeat protein n=1 Tax=Candidatus Leptofilum sp. TaxID=3241576 RepID=UPI003B59A7FB
MNESTKEPKDDLKFEALFQRGSELLHRGKVNDAVPVLQQAHALDPEHFDAALNLSGAYILTKKFKQAARLLEWLRDQAPNNVMVWTNLGAAYLGNPVLARDEEQLQAIAAFKEALAIDPIAPNVAYNIGLIYRDRREYESAISWFEQAVKANPHDKDAQNLIKKLRDMNGRS